MDVTSLDRRDRPPGRARKQRRRRIRRALIALAAALATSSVVVPRLAPAAWAAEPVGNRLIANADFEATPTTDFPVPGWSLQQTGGSVSTSLVSGDRVVHITQASGTGQPYAKSEYFAVLPGEQVTATASTRNLSGAAGTLRLQFYSVDDDERPYITQPNGHSQVDATVSSAWHSTTVTAFTPDEAVFATVAVVGRTTGVNEWDDVAVTTTPPSRFIVPDAGFEETRVDPGHRPGFWSLTTLGTGSASRRENLANAWGGRRYLQLVDPNDTSNAVALSRRLPVSATTTPSLTLSLMARRVSGTTGTVALRFFDSSGTYLSTASPAPKVVESTPGGWKPLSISATVPSSARSLDVDIYAAKPGAGTTYYDEVRITATAAPAYESAVSTGTVLFVGDQRVDTATDELTRVIHPGTKVPGVTAGRDGTIIDWTPPATTSTRSVVSRTVLKETATETTTCAVSGDPVWRMWTESQMIENDDPETGWPTSSTDPCVHPVTTTFTSNVPSACPAQWDSVAAPPAAIVPDGSGGYLGLKARTLRTLKPGGVCTNDDDWVAQSSNIYAFSSPDGITWTQIGPSFVIPGRDTVNLTKVGDVYRAQVKQWTLSGGSYGWQPRSAWVTESTDFLHWSAPTFSMAADSIDMQNVKALGTGAVTDVYQLPAAQYGDQVIGLPWMFDIRKPTLLPGSDADGLPGPNTDIGVEHIEIAASTDGINWSRPARGPIVAKGASGAWDWGFMMTSQGLRVEGDQTLLHYSSYEGEHSCGPVDTGCTLQGPSRAGLVTWPRDRMVSWHATGTGTLTTRPLQPEADAGTLTINATGGVRVAVVDSSGEVVSGYGLADSTLTATGDGLTSTVSWGSAPDLPSLSSVGGHLRLRIEVTDGDLYAFTID